MGGKDAPSTATTSPQTLAQAPNPDVLVPPLVELGAPPAHVVPSPQIAGLYLKQDDKIYQIDNQATLQRWVIERRAMPHDLISNDGINWEPASRRASLSSFFAAIEQIDTLIEATAEIHVPDPSTIEDFGVAPTPLKPVEPSTDAATKETTVDTEATNDIFKPIDPEPEAESKQTDDSLIEPLNESLLDLPDLSLAPTKPQSSVDNKSLIEAPTQESPRPESIPDLSDPFASFEIDEEIVTTESLPISIGESSIANDTLDSLDYAAPQTFEVPKETPSEPVPESPIPASFDDEAELDPLPEGEGVDSFYSSFEIPHTDPALSVNWGPSPSNAKTIKIVIGVVGLLGVGIVGASLMNTNTEQTIMPPPAVTTPVDIAPEPVVTDTSADDKAEETAPTPAASTAPEETVAVPVVSQKTKKPTVTKTVAKPPISTTKTTTKTTQPAVTKTTTVVKKTTSAVKPVSSATISALLNKAWADVDIGRLDSAADKFKTLLSSNPTNPDANFGYGYVLYQQGKNNSGESYLCNALRYATEGSSTHKEATGILKSNRVTCP